MRLFLFTVLATLSICCTSETHCQNTNAVNVVETVILKNNPSCPLYLKTPYRTFDWQSEPELEIRFLQSAAIAGYNVIASVTDSNNHILFIDSIIATSAAQTKGISFKLAKPLIHPKFIGIIIKNGKELVSFHKQAADLVKLHGTVTDFNGNPIAGAWVVNLGNPFQIVSSNANGEYSMYLPKGNYNCIAAMVNTYPRKSLENYIWNLPLKDDYLYNFKVDKAEVFRLMASTMPQNKIISGSFISWTCSAINSWMNSKTTAEYKQDDSLFMDPYLPLLKKELIKFYLDDIEITEIPLFERTSVLVYANKVFNAGYRFEFSVPKNLPSREFHVLKVEINYPGKDNNGNHITERGQATLHNITIY